MQPGDVVAERFEILELTGSGGMGDVYRALDRTTGASVALKSLRAQGGDAERFLREAEILAELRHPSIVRHVAHGQSGVGALYLAMEWLDGEDLSARLARAPLDVVDSLALITRVAEALAVVHARGVLHRDLKPGNIFLVGGDVARAKLLDFGVARMSGGARTRTGSALGTPGYMAPEQARGARELGAPVDVFALGCVLFECITGRPAFTGDHAVVILGKILFEEAPRVREVRPDVSPELDALVARMLAKSADDRPANAAALLKEISRLGEVSGPAPVASKRPPPLLTGGEQRLLSVVMAREATSGGADAATIGAGSVDDSLARIHALASRYGARIDRIGDGTLVGVIAIRGSATDQSASAARFALALQAELGGARVIAATGRGVVSDRWPIGDAIERAAVLLGDATNAPTGDVTIDATTAGLVEGRFDIQRTDGRISLLRERAALDSARLLLGKPTPCLGRDRELSMLETILAESSQDSVARVVLVTGPAGAGKSRLLSEFLRRIGSYESPPERWVGRADATRAGSPFGLVAPLLRVAMDVHEGDSEPAQRERVRARVARHVEGAAKVRVAEFLGEMIGVAFPEEPGSALQQARRDALLMSDQMSRAFEELVDAELGAGPLVILLEDIHWGDLPSLTLFDRVLRNLKDRPLFVLAMARPDVRETFPKLWSARDLTELRLAGLSPKAAEKLVKNALGAIDSARVDAIVTRADGNAFYLEELIRAEFEGRRDGLPETVLAMVQMRLEALSDEARRVLRAASVFGESFWDGGVRALLGERSRDATEWLDDLIERETVQSVEPSRFPEHHEYRFRHAIVREAAYDLLTDPDRALGHRLVARWLTDVGEHDASALALHHRRGGAIELAIACYVRAAEQALEANDFAGAMLRADEAIGCGASGRELGALRRVQADAHRWSGRVAEAADCGAEAMDLLEPGSIEWCRAAEACASTPLLEGLADAEARCERLIDGLLAVEPRPGAEVSLCGAMCMLARSMFLVSRFDAGHRLFLRIEPLVDSFDGKERGISALFSHCRAVRARMDGDPSTSVRLNAIALAEYQALGAHRQELFIANNLADCLLQLGAYEQVIDVLRSVLPVAEKMALDRETSLGNLNLSLALAEVGRHEEARACVDEGLRLYTARGNRRYVIIALTNRAIVLAAANRLDLAAEDAREALASAAEFPSTQPTALGVLADIELRRGNLEDARRIATEAMERLASFGAILEGAELIRLTHARVLHRFGAVDQAKAAITDARDRILRSASLIGDPEHRNSFLRVRVHAETLQLAEEWLA